MTKAFTEEERIEIKEKIMETALDLFHDKGTKSLNIKELTKRVGIAQGSFYSFWKDKESLIIDLIAYRSMQKLNKIEKDFANSLEDPINFLTDVIYKYSIDLIAKAEIQPVYKDAFKVLSTRKKSDINKIENLYGEFLYRLIEYWKSNNVVKKIDEKGLSNAFIGSFVLCSNFYHFDEEYFSKILKIYVLNVVNTYVEV